MTDSGADAIEVRRAVPADGPAFVSLVCELARFEKLPLPDEDARGRLVADAFANPPRFDLWVAAIDGGVIAYAVTFATYSTFLARPTLFLEDIFVHPRARRRGVATALLSALRAEAQARGCGRLEWMVLDWNDGAQALFRQAGARMHGEWRLMRAVLERPGRPDPTA